MIFEWDAAKSRVNAKARGLPFEIAVAMFDAPTLEVPDRRQQYGELRVKATGIVRGIVLAAIYTDRPGARRIISLRVANRKERHAYRAAYPS
ncbi:MAG: BrnT family toxin [Proteobacteria bacterium]|nr:BrnT family toxin [Pseudomonadota bacterium]MBI3498638.1 BrnT family toxin [Pseudomonadota bacterium]